MTNVIFQSQSPQESVIQQARSREPQATPTASIVAHGNPQPSLPSPQQQLQMLSRAGFQVAMATPLTRGMAELQATPTSSQGIQAAVQVPQMGGVSPGGAATIPGLMPQLVVSVCVCVCVMVMLCVQVNPAAMQNQPVLLPLQVRFQN